MNGFVQITERLYLVKNQNGLKNTLYDFYGAADNDEDFTKTKKLKNENMGLPSEV